MSRISFNVAAKCDKAGRTQNQDNYLVCPNLSQINDSFNDIIGCDKDVVLSDKGALLVVADGMGGMNAGEVASELVIKHIKESFSNIPTAILGDETQMLSFIKNSIINADQHIKDYANEHREADGMGSTIVLVWFWGTKAYCGWCGDSRIYRYNPNNELVRLSHDHSYVQELVDSGKICLEDAFDHPDGNIVTRALGDNGEKANPELRAYDICERDVFLLCSDGLCGLLQDNQIQDIISLNCSSTKDALNALWKAGDSAGWSDNATIELLNIIEGGMRPKGVAVGYPVKKVPVQVAPKPAHSSKVEIPKNNETPRKVQPRILVYIISLVVMAALAIVLFRTCSKNRSERIEQNGGESTNSKFNYDTHSVIDSTITSPAVKGSDHGRRVGGTKGTPTPNGTTASGAKTNPSSTNHTEIEAISHAEKPEPVRQVSNDYQRLYNNVKDDYLGIMRLWNSYQNQQIIPPDKYDQFNQFTKNVHQLRTKPDYEILDIEEKKFITDQLEPLARNIKDKLKSITRTYEGGGNVSNGAILVE